MAPQLVDGELALCLVGALGHEPTACHDLDHVHAALGMVTHRTTHSIGASLGHSTQEVTVPARRGERGPGAHDRRQALRVPHGERQISPVTKVAHRRDPSHRSCPRGRPDRVEGGGVVACGEGADRIGGGIEGQVNMGVHETR